MGAGTMAVRLFISADGGLRDMGEPGAAGHVNIHVPRAFAPLLPRHEVDLADVGDEVRVQNTAVVFREIFSLFGEKFRVAGIEAVFEHIIRVVDKLRIAEELERNRLAGQTEIATRLRTARIEVLMPRIERNGEG